MKEKEWLAMKNEGLVVVILNNLKKIGIIVNIAVIGLFIIVILEIMANINHGKFNKTIAVQYTIVGACTDNRINKKYEIRYYPDDGDNNYKLYDGSKEVVIDWCSYNRVSMGVVQVDEELDDKALKSYADTDIKYKYNIPIDLSYRYINYLYRSGYQLDLEIDTPRLIELFMCKGNKRLRVVVYNTYMLVGEISNKAVIPDGLEILKEEIVETDE